MYWLGFPSTRACERSVSLVTKSSQEPAASVIAVQERHASSSVGVHASADSNYKWEGYNLLTGGWFDQHPWNTFDAPIILEDADFPAVRHFPKAFLKRDEIYQLKNWSRDTATRFTRAPSA